VTARSLSAGQVMTVLGPVPAGELGLVLPHEHILIDLSPYFFVRPTSARDLELSREPISLENLSWVRYNTRHSLDCQRLTDREAAAAEVDLFGRAGGGTIVEATCRQLGRDPLGLARVSQATGVKIIMGTGYYTADTHPPELAQRGEIELAEEMLAEINEGVDGTGIRAGVIGELGCSWPLKESEAKALRAGALAQRLSGLAIIVHPSRNEAGPWEAVEALAGAGADLSRVVISHMDRCGYLLENRIRLLEAGCFIAYDLFGKEGYYPAEPALADGHLPDMPNDLGRIREIADLIERGWLSQILISQDNCLKTNLCRWGGPGYAHLVERAIPRMRIYGYTGEQIKTLTEDNPRRMLAGA